MSLRRSRVRAGPWAFLAFLALWAATGALASASVIERGRLLASGNGEHLWWILPAAPPGEESRLLHGYTGAEELRSRTASVHRDAPEALASRGARAWVVFAPATAGERREVITLEARRHPATGLFVSAPGTGPELAASLPAFGHLGGFEADARGPWALILPGPAERFGVRRDGVRAEADVRAGTEGPILLRLAGNAWEEVPLPELLHGAAIGQRGLRLGVFGEEIGLVTSVGRRTRLFRFDPSVESSWREVGSFLPAGVSGASGESNWGDPVIIEAAGRVALAATAGEFIRLFYLRESELVPWAEVARPRGPFAILGDDRGAILLDQVREGDRAIEQVRGARIDPLAAGAQPPAVFQEQHPANEGWMHLPVIVMFTVMILLGFLFVRELNATRREGEAGSPAADAAPPVPPMPMPRRFAALAIDLLPGAILALFLFDARPGDLLHLPSFAADRAAADPAILMILVTTLHGTLGEMLTSRSIGKWICGGIVLAPDGSPLSAGRALLRGLVKLLVLAAPVLGLVALFSADGRGVQDVIARSIAADARPGAGLNDSTPK